MQIVQMNLLLHTDSKGHPDSPESYSSFCTVLLFLCLFLFLGFLISSFRESDADDKLDPDPVLLGLLGVLSSLL